MRFRNSLRLLMENFKHVYKLFFSKLIITVVATALCCAFVLPELIEIWTSVEVEVLVEKLKEAMKVLFSADPDAMEAIKEELLGENGAFKGVAKLLASMRTEILWVCIGCAVVYLIRRFAETVCHFTTGCMLNDKMSTYAETPFATSFVANLGKACTYSAVYVPVIFLFDVIMVGVAYFILTLTPALLGGFLSTTLIALCQAVKLTFTCRWMPAMTADGYKLSQTIRYADKKEKKQRAKVFSTYLVSVYCIMIINVMAVLATFGSALIVTVPASYFFLICVQYVNYYTLKGKKYFLTYEQIASNPDKGDREHFFEYISDEEKRETEEN